MKKYKIMNLDCANCALKIERTLKNLRGVKKVSLNFAAQSLFIDTDHIDLVRQTITRIEPGVTITETDLNFNTTAVLKFNIMNKDLLMIAIGTLLFLTALIIRSLHIIEHAFLEIIIFLPAYLLLGRLVITKAIQNSIRGQLFDEYFLMSMATIGALFIGASAEAVSVMLFYQIGEYVQNRAVNKSRAAIKSLLEIRPDKANRLDLAGNLLVLHPSEIKTGETIVIRPGEKIPLDGTVIKGESWLDTSALTGESASRQIRVTQVVLAGMLNMTGVLTVKVDRPYNQSSIYKILELVESAVQNKAPLESFITKLARFYTPIVVLLASLIAIIPPLVVPNALFSEWIYRALVILVISCPCALVISIPLGYFGGIGAASKNGILIKGANYLDILRKIKIVVFDKTGTLTEGKFSITNITPFNDFTKDEILKAAALAEYHSTHPLAEVIKQNYGQPINHSSIEIHQEIAGLGVKALAEGKHIVAGNDKILHQEKISHTTCAVGNPGEIVIHVGINNQYAGYIQIADKCKDKALDSIHELRQQGITDIIMLTGDRQETASVVAGELGISTFYADLLPEQKLLLLDEMINRDQSPHRPLYMFVGDGINDAPVIALADLGVSMGNIGSDAAIDISNIVILNDSLKKIPQAIRIGKKTHQIVIQNVMLAFGVKLIFVVLGAAGVATMWEAVFADMGVTLLAIFNAIRTQRSAFSI
ncbi:MAG: cadmium-translocating P-type ATPase [Bdellovibrionales bacterium RIFOXYB1_FULL_37_110]|nr:MAG: cadmium-translocating P-type ATPase [Bdellovibrionales bacterium RIFOXYC1_FULL_37_79]OFZ60148.1 MAG: cadmium-translocating P-type ATPase [Bdellovibrionales bacterium RIFOXYB1_FULL_37_110]OFZ64358.1 MAG: cadmium-translocating P-type ATPase [Bdellovibrionales bacterium RIFOXYD1_FULL_36_51]